MPTHALVCSPVMPPTTSAPAAAFQGLAQLPPFLGATSDPTPPLRRGTSLCASLWLCPQCILGGVSGLLLTAGSAADPSLHVPPPASGPEAGEAPVRHRAAVCAEAADALTVASLHGPSPRTLSSLVAMSTSVTAPEATGKPGRVRSRQGADPPQPRDARCQVLGPSAHPRQQHRDSGPAGEEGRRASQAQKPRPSEHSLRSPQVAGLAARLPHTLQRPRHPGSLVCTVHWTPQRQRRWDLPFGLGPGTACPPGTRAPSS